MVKLDAKDFHILHELSQNARISITQLAQKVRLSREVTNYRINRLIQENVIVDFITEIDEVQLGYSRFLLYLAFHNVDEHKEKELIEALIKHPFVSWSTTSTGKWSIIVDFLAKDIHHMNTLFLEFKKKYNLFIHEYLIVPLLSYQHFNSKYCSPTTDFFLSKKQKKHAVSRSVDLVDLEILKVLSNHARKEYVALSKQLLLSPNAIKERIKTLIEAGVICGFSIQVNKVLLGYEQYYLQLSFNNQTKEEEQLVLEYIIQHPKMNAYYQPLGYSILEVAVFVRNPGELRRIILDLRNQFGSRLEIKDMFLLYEEPKSNYLPVGVFQFEKN